MALRAWMLLCLEILLCYGTITSAISKKGAPPDTVGRRLQVEERVVSALRKSGRYRVASSLLDAIDINQVLPATCTLLIPDDSAASQLQFQNFTTALPVLQYHVLTQLLSFPDLLKLPIGSSLSTMLSGRPVLVTNTSRRNFTLNDIRLSRPDLYLGDGLIVHGLEGILNFTDPISSSSHSPPSPPSSTPKPPSSPTSPPSTPSTPPPSPPPPPPPSPPPSMSIFSSPPPPSPPTSSPPSPPIGSPPSPPTSSLPPIIFPGISPPPPPPPPSPLDGPFTGPFDKNNMSQNFPFSSTASIPPCFPNSKMLILCSGILLLSTMFS